MKPLIGMLLGTSGWLRMRATSSTTACFGSADRQPLDVLAGARSWAFADVTEAARGELRRFQAGGQQATHHFVGEELHAAVGVMNDEKFLGTQQFVADDQGANRVIAGAAAGIANHVRIALREARRTWRDRAGHPCR